MYVCVCVCVCVFVCVCVTLSLVFGRWQRLARGRLNGRPSSKSAAFERNSTCDYQSPRAVGKPLSSRGQSLSITQPMEMRCG